MEDHPTAEDFSRFLQQGSRRIDTKRNALVVRHLLSNCATCRRTISKIRELSGLLPRLVDLPQKASERVAVDYDWTFAKVQRTLSALQRPLERLPERLAELSGLPEDEQIRRVSREARFADPEFIDCLLARSYGARYRNPQETLHLAYLARLATEACRPHAVGGKAQLADLRTRAWGQYGNALRIAGRPQEAEGAFATAQGYRKAGTGDLRLHGWLLDKTTPFAIFQDRFDDAIQTCSETEAIHERFGDSHRLAGSLVQKAIALLYSGHAERAVATLNRAIPLVDPQEDPNVLLAAHHNLAHCYLDLDRPDEALACHHSARPLYQKCKDPLILLRVTWQKGTLLREVGHLRNAEAALLCARQGFTEQGLTYEAALVCLDLAEAYSKLGTDVKVRQMIDEAAPIFRGLGVGRKEQAFLGRLQQSLDPADGADKGT